MLNEKELHLYNFKCSNCGKNIKKKIGKSGLKYCSKECYNEYRKNNIVPRKDPRNNIKLVKCDNCGKEIKKKTDNIFELIYCNMKCYNEYRKNNIIPKTNYKYKTPMVECSNCKKTFRKNIGKSGLIYCSKECYNEYRKNNIVPRNDTRKNVKLICKFCGKEYEVYRCREKISKYCSLQCHNISNYLNMPFKETSIEIKLENILKKINIKYIKQKQISNKTVVDFFVEPNITIYADGDYWHNLDYNKIKDIKINKYLKENKYVVIRYSEKDINNNEEYIISDLKNKIII